MLSEEEGEEEDEEEDILSLAEEKYRPAALEKMIALIALLVEQSRSERSGTNQGTAFAPHDPSLSNLFLRVRGKRLLKELGSLFHIFRQPVVTAL